MTIIINEKKYSSIELPSDTKDFLAEKPGAVIDAQKKYSIVAQLASSPDSVSEKIELCPIEIAAILGKLAVVKKLLPNSPVNIGVVFTHAAANGYVEVVRELIEKHFHVPDASEVYLCFRNH